MKIKNLIKIHNNQVKISIQTVDDKKYINQYYEELLEIQIQKNIPNSFSILSKKYEFDLKNFNLECIEILKMIYNSPYNYNVDYIHNKIKTIKYLKKNKFIRYDKVKNLYKMTKKTKLFLFEFNANFWLGKYNKIIENYTQTLKTNFKYSWKQIFNDFNRELNKEIKYINNQD